MRSVVLLPQPDGPTSTTNSPSPISQIEVAHGRVRAARLRIFFGPASSSTLAMRTHHAYG